MAQLGLMFVESQQYQQNYYNETLMASCLYCIGECASMIEEPASIIDTIV